MRIFLLLFLYCLSLGAEDFISDFEYGQMLYRDSRGVSCVPCHGETGEGRFIASYRNRKGQKIEVSGPDIRQATLSQIQEAMHKGPGWMPRYFLTDKEIAMIYAYLQEVNRQYSGQREGATETSPEAAPMVDANHSQGSSVKKKIKKKINPWEGIE